MLAGEATKVKLFPSPSARSLPSREMITFSDAGDRRPPAGKPTQAPLAFRLRALVAGLR